ncbi:acyl carrier protein [Streptomyces pinistramenti]|uniref:acyl carrier protein n=1 Tax=Streptomyces pinistramenti TaxID=2884812 RepID=UPI001D07975D|nr:phosphopantetheine-binding protein [Streptomyces pinistramenti]MCB5909697.1 phosphopantetheine-binding protein [Streptomyces pinistramenti]
MSFWAVDRYRRRRLERALTELWCAALRSEKIGRTQRFIELGGDSVTAVRIVSAVEERLGVSLSVRVLMETQTIAGMAEHIQRRSRAEQGAAP